MIIFLYALRKSRYGGKQKLNKKIKLAAAGLVLAVILTGCGESPELTRFKNEMDSFCSDISEIDTAINNVDASSESAVTEVLVNLDKLDERFQDFAELDFPKEFDYLEKFADEAAAYMTAAVAGYRDAYTNENYDEAAAAAQYEYASENYSRAYKRIQIIIALLHGKDPEEIGLATQSEPESSPSAPQ